MNPTLLTTGLACVIAAIVGGGFKAFGIEVPVLASTRRQIVLASFGALLLLAAVAAAYAPGSERRVSPWRPQTGVATENRLANRAGLLDELQRNKTTINKLREGLSEQAVHYATQEEAISRQEKAIARGEGTPQVRAEAQGVIDEARQAIREAREVDARAREKIGQLEQRNREIERQLADT